MNTAEELRNNLVMVNPLANDPAGKQSQIGSITAVNLDRDDIYVAFEDGTQSLYGSDTLLVMKAGRELYSDLMNNKLDMEPGDFKTLFRINLMEDQHPRQTLDAMKLAQTNEFVMKHSMETLQERLGASREQYTER